MIDQSSMRLILLWHSYRKEGKQIHEYVKIKIKGCETGWFPSQPCQFWPSDVIKLYSFLRIWTVKAGDIQINLRLMIFIGTVETMEGIWEWPFGYELLGCW